MFSFSHTHYGKALYSRHKTHVVTANMKATSTTTTNIDEWRRRRHNESQIGQDNLRSKKSKQNPMILFNKQQFSQLIKFVKFFDQVNFFPKKIKDVKIFNICYNNFLKFGSNSVFIFCLFFKKL